MQRARPLPLRLAGYLQERFPLASTGTFVALFFASAALVAVRLGGGGSAHWTGAAVVLLVFFRLRVADEHKDWEVDRVEHPERLLSKGVITLGQLRAAAWGAFAVEALIVVAIGPRAVVAWAAVCAFAVAMRWEFGAGRWLRRHLGVYALTHNPIVALLAVFAWACTGAPFAASFGWYVALATVAALAYELGRKAEVYAAALGSRWTRAALVACYLAGALTLGALISAMELTRLPPAAGWALALGPAFGGLALLRRGEGASSSVFLTSSFALALVAALGAR